MDPSKAIDSFITKAHGDPVQIAKLSAEHRQNRNKYRGVLLGPDYPGVPIDEILTARLNDPDYPDPGNNLCLFAWPAKEVTDLISRIQQELRILAPTELKTNAEKAKPHAAKFTAFVAEHPAGLDRPMLSWDDTAVALTFLPVEDSRYTYLHLRRDFANICAESDVEVNS